MKKLLYFAPAVALLLGSCSDELTNPNATVSKEYKSKLVASYEGGNAETRTTMQSVVNGKYAYAWSVTDQIGLIQAGSTALNASFENEGGVNGNVFGGSVSLPMNEDYVGYYPYSPTPFNGTDLQLEISADQVYNKKSNQTQIGSNATGSFANNAAPAVGVGQVTAQDNLDIKLYAVGSYLAFPVTGYGNITSVKLSLGNNSYIAGPVSVTNAADFVEFAAEVDPSTNPNESNINIPGITYPTSEGGSQYITLNCGSGVELDAETPTYFWFVIPAGTPLNTTVSLTLTADDDPDTAQELTRNLSNVNFPWKNNFSQLNYVLKVNADGGVPFYYTPKGKAIIQTQYQFLEYVNLVTIGLDAAVQQYNDMAQSSPVQAGHSYLPGFVNGTLTDGKIENANAVNSAIIVDDITISQQDIKNYIGEGNGLFEGALNNYYDFFQYYATNGYLAQPIGGKAEFTMNGEEVETVPAAAGANVPFTSINGLVVKGGTVFANGTEDYQISVNDLVLNDVTLISTQSSNDFYPFLSNPIWSSFNNVTVGEGCNIKGVDASKAGVFNTIYNAWYTYNVTNLSEINQISKFADTLVINAEHEGDDNSKFGFNFAIEGRGVNAFNTIQIDEWYAALAIEDQKADAYNLMNIVENPGNYSYYVFGIEEDEETGDYIPQTSYWTGSVTGSRYSYNGTSYETAEHLAWATNYAANETTAHTIELNINLDLMGDVLSNPTAYPDNENVKPYWAAINRSEVAVNGVADEETGKPLYSISNVYINGTTDGEKTAKNRFFALLGGSGSASDLVVNNVVIDNTETSVQPYYNGTDNYAVVGAIAGLCTSATNVTVNGLDINLTNTSDNNYYCGGLFGYIKNNLSADNYSDLNISGMNAEGVSEGEGEVAFGYIAGNWIFNINSKNVDETNSIAFTNPFTTVDTEYEPFAHYSLSVMTPPQGTTYSVYFNGFTNLNVPELTFAAVENAAGAMPEGKNTLMVYNNNKLYYFWYQTSTKAYVYSQYWE